MESIDVAVPRPPDPASPAEHADPHGAQREHMPGTYRALDSEPFQAGVLILVRRFAPARITSWPDGSHTVLRTVAEQREAYAVLSDAQWVVPVTEDGYLLPSV